MSIEAKFGSEPKLNFRTTVGALGIPVGAKVAEGLGIIPPQTWQTYALLTSAPAFVGLGIDTVIHSVKDTLKNAKIINAALE